MNMEESENIQEAPAPQPAVPRKNINIPTTVSILSLLISVAVLIIIFTTGKSRNNETIQRTSDGKITIAWINTDTIWNQYKFVKDIKDYLAKYEADLQNQYNATVTAFQKEYDEYLKKGTSNQLTLDEQKQAEEKLSKKQQYISELDAKLTQQLVDEKTAKNMEVHDSIVNFIARFNKGRNYTFIMERSYGGGILWADSTLEITNQVLKGLNEEYEAKKKLKESVKEE